MNDEKVVPFNSSAALIEEAKKERQGWSLTATKAPKVVKYLSSNGAAFFREKNLGSRWIACRALDGN
jgi:hypothetical protein